MKAKLTGWSFLNLGQKCEKATRVNLSVLLVPSCSGLDNQLFRCAEAIRAMASSLRADRLSRKRKLARGRQVVR